MSAENPTSNPVDGTRVVRAGLPEAVKHEPTLPGPVFAAHYHLPGDPTGPYAYGRDQNPTWTANLTMRPARMTCGTSQDTPLVP